MFAISMFQHCVQKLGYYDREEKQNEKTEIIIKNSGNIIRKNFSHYYFGGIHLQLAFLLNQYINISKIEIAKTCFTPRKAPFI